MTYVIRPMRLEDVDEVSRVERMCFSTPWPAQAYRREIRENKLSRYIVVAEVPEEQTAASANSDGGPGLDTSEGPDSGPVRKAISNFLRPLGRREPEKLAEPSRERLVGFAGMWLVIDEAHITTIGVHPSWRGRGLGALMLSHLMVLAKEMGSQRVTLEVRITNSQAQALYRKYGFKVEGTRPRYYSDNNEDALIMWSGHLDSPDYMRRLDELQAEVLRRVKAVTVA